MKVKFKWVSEKDRISGFRYLWLKTVRDFNPQHHCARCLVGEYSKSFSPDMSINSFIEQEYSLSELVYFCGVSNPYKWANNFHFAGTVTSKNISTEIKLFTGDRLIVQGVEPIEIKPDKASELYPQKGEKYLTCRNFQFAAQVFQSAYYTPKLNFDD